MPKQPVLPGALAERLITRHLRVSVPDYAVRQQLQQQSTSAPEFLDKHVRCVAVVGAGASAPLLSRADDLATSLEKRFKSLEEDRRAELFRLQRVYGMNPDDFETRLAALSAAPQAAQAVRQAIATDYTHRHPTLLGYELLAHLLKHRFLDAVLTFNFDELLDQSLEDELGRSEFRRLVSDRDCTDVVADADSPDFLPLYVKLHGTATEPESLRFTRESYFDLPGDLLQKVHDLLDCDLCVVVNVGSGLGGFDLHRLLRIPAELEIHDLSKYPLTKTVRGSIDRERTDPIDDSFNPEEKRSPVAFHSPPASGKNQHQDSEYWLRRLISEIDRRSGSNAKPGALAAHVRFRSVLRHEAVTEVLPPSVVLPKNPEKPDRHQVSLKRYLRRRTILELALSGAKARGLAQLSWLAVDRSGSHYEMYCRNPTSTRRPWNELREAAGLSEDKWLSDVVIAQEALSRLGPTMKAEGRWVLREFDHKALAKHVIGHLDSDVSAKARKTLERAIEELQRTSEVEINATDDRVCGKAFKQPRILPTTTALNIYTKRLFSDLQPGDNVYISCETGEWLLQDERMFDLLSKQEHVQVVTAFDLKRSELDLQYDDNVEFIRIDPWRHNRHMTIVCRGTTPMRAVYFARRLRTPVITPVYLDSPEDANRVFRSFEVMRDGSEGRSGISDTEISED